MHDIFQHAPEVLYHAEHLLVAMRDYESIASLEEYRPSRASAPLYMKITAYGVVLEAALSKCGYKLEHDGWLSSPNGVALPDKLYSSLAGIAELCQEIRLRRHAKTTEELSAVSTSWGITANGGWCPDLGVGATFPRMEVHLKKLSIHVERLREALNGTRPPTSPWRVSFDVDTQTVTLDGVPHKVENPKAFALYVEILKNRPQPLTKATLQTKVKGCSGIKTIPRLLKELPERLYKTIVTNNNGFHFDADANAKRRQQKKPRRKKGHT
jgi:hypothetical protein